MANVQAKRRLDQYLVEAGYYPSRSQAAAAILAGDVRIAGRIAKPGDPIREVPAIEIRLRPRFASRGGEKLAAAIDRWPIVVTDHVVADLGASTGGFTDCLLQHGAKQVFAVDVGRGQLAMALRQDPRVMVMERVNARYLTRESFPANLNGVTIDVSFISLKLILPAVVKFLSRDPDSFGVALVKPQFEAGRERVGRHGVVRDPQVHHSVLTEIIGVASDLGLCPWAVTASPLRGPEGNVEFLLGLIGDGTKPRAALVGDEVETAIAHALAEAPVK